MSIHPLAAVSPYALLGNNVKIGPFSVVEPGVEIGDNTTLASRVVVRTGTSLGRDNIVCEGAVLGGMPQHLHMPEFPGRVVIGDGNVIRENVTVHRAMEADKVTRIGNGCLLMVGAHVAHDCTLGNNVILTNNSMLGGHVTVGDRAYVSGGVGGASVLPHRPAGDGRRPGPRAARRAAVRDGRRRLDDGGRPQSRRPAPGRLHAAARCIDLKEPTA